MGTHINILASILTLFLSIPSLSAGSAAAAEKPVVDMSLSGMERVVARKDSQSSQIDRAEDKGFKPPDKGDGPPNTDSSGSR